MLASHEPSEKLLIHEYLISIKPQHLIQKLILLDQFHQTFFFACIIIIKCTGQKSELNLDLFKRINSIKSANKVAEIYLGDRNRLDYKHCFPSGAAGQLDCSF